jgi:hypothetical protein
MITAWSNLAPPTVAKEYKHANRQCLGDAHVATYWRSSGSMFHVPVVAT